MRLKSRAQRTFSAKCENVKCQRTGCSIGLFPRLRDGPCLRSCQCRGLTIMSMNRWLPVHFGEAEPGVHPVPDQLAHLLRQRERLLERHLQIVVLFLAYPSDGERDEQAAPYRVRPVRTCAVQHATGPEEDRTGGHPGRDDLVVPSDATLWPVMAARHEPGCPVRLREIGHGPHARRHQVGAWTR